MTPYNRDTSKNLENLSIKIFKAEKSDPRRHFIHILRSCCHNKQEHKKHF